MWTIIANLLSGPIIGGLLKAYQAKLDAQGSTEGRKVTLAEKAMELDAKEATLNNALLIAEQGHWFTRTVRPALGWAAVILTWKIIVWDLALGQWTHGRTDMLSNQAYWLLTTIIIAYMGGRTAEKVAGKIADVLKR